MRITIKARTWLLAALVAGAFAITPAAQMAKANPQLMLGAEGQHQVALNFTKITYNTTG